MTVTNQLTFFTVLLSAKTAMTERPSQVARYFSFYSQKTTYYTLSYNFFLQLWSNAVKSGVTSERVLQYFKSV